MIASSVSLRAISSEGGPLIVGSGALGQSVIRNRGGSSAAIVIPSPAQTVSLLEGSPLVAKLEDGAWRGRTKHGRPTLITKTPDGGRRFQTQRADGTWS